MQKIRKIVEFENKKYKKKGIKNIILAFSLFFGIIKVSHCIGQIYWPQQILDRTQFVIVAGIVCNLGFHLISFILYLPGYMKWSNYYEENRINKTSLRPWERRTWPQVLSKTIKNLVINQLIIYPLAVYLTNSAGVGVRFINFPSFFEFFCQIVVIYYFEDLCFYWAHRAFHAFPFLYKMHKVHHEYDTLFTWVTEYFHPLDFLFGNLLPSGVIFIILGSKVHCFTILFWVCWIVLSSTESHSGYEFKWSPTRIMPFIAGSSYHDHHHSHNSGNFSGSCYVWDLLMGTNDAYINDFLKE